MNRGTMYTWLDRRLNLKSVERTLLDEPIPGGASWIYVFGSATLFLIVMVFAFTGYLLPWDQTAYWATQIGLNMVGTVPLVGEFLMKVMQGGEVLGALTLSRFFAAHVLFLPAILVTLIVAHLFILRRVAPTGPRTDERASLAARLSIRGRAIWTPWSCWRCLPS